MTTLTATCPVCQGRGWVRQGLWPAECGECTPTKTRAGKTVLDAQRVSAILKRREEDSRTEARRGFIAIPPHVDDRPTYEYD